MYLFLSLNNKYINNLHLAENSHRREWARPVHPFVLDRASLPLAVWERREERERVYPEAEDAAPAKDLVCAARPVIARGTFRISISGPRSFTEPSSTLSWLPYPFVPFIPATLRFVSRPGAAGVSSLPYDSSILALLALGLSYVSLVVARIAVFLPGIFFFFFFFGEHLVVGTRTKETCSLRKSQEARGWLAPAVRLIYLFLVT